MSHGCLSAAIQPLWRSRASQAERDKRERLFEPRSGDFLSKIESFPALSDEKQRVVRVAETGLEKGADRVDPGISR